MAEIAVAAEERIESRNVANGSGWTVDDVVCSCGPGDRPYGEQHEHVVIALVTSGTFQYRGSGSNGREMMTPGSLLLGNPGQAFECGHEHAVGDRCLSFRFAPEYFDAIAGASRAGRRRRVFRSLRLPPVAVLSPVIAEVRGSLVKPREIAWEEIGIRLAASAVRADGDLEPDRSPTTPAAIARVTRTVRMIEERPAAGLTIVRMAQEAGLSPFHFLRTFERLTGITPHQYIRRAQLRAAAAALISRADRILDVAFDAGFGDVSNFNHAFRAEFGVSPRTYRLRHTAGRF